MPEEKTDSQKIEEIYQKVYELHLKVEMIESGMVAAKNWFIENGPSFPFVGPYLRNKFREAGLK